MFAGEGRCSCSSMILSCGKIAPVLLFVLLLSKSGTVGLVGGMTVLRGR